MDIEDKTGRDTEKGEGNTMSNKINDTNTKDN